MGLMSQELLDAIAAGETVVAVVEHDIGGTTYRYGPGWIASDTGGLYKAQVKRFGRISRAVSLRGGRLQSSGTSATIEDSDQGIHQLIEGQYARSIKGSDARVKIISPAIDSTKYFTAFDGEIDSFRQDSPRVWTFQYAPKDKPLRGYLRTPLISDADWPDADDSAVGERSPIVFGTHESTGSGANGMVPTYYVDTVGYQYLISAGSLKALNDVFKDGASVGGWVIRYWDINGRRYTVIDFGSSQGSSVITCDVEGLTDNGYSSGTEVTNPAEQLKILLKSWVFSEYQRGAYPADSTVPIDTSSFARAAVFFDNHNIVGSRVISGSRTGEAVLNGWCEQFQMACYWTNDGKIAIAPDDYGIDDLYFDWPWLTERHLLGHPRYHYSTELLADEVRSNFLHSEADNKFFDSVRVKDTLRGWDVAEELNLNWARSSV